MTRQTPPTKSSSTMSSTTTSSASRRRRRLGDMPGARGALAGLVLVAGVGLVLAAAEAGPLRVGAGDVDIRLARGDSGYTMSVSARPCPPKCDFDLDWKPNWGSSSLAIGR